MPRRNRLTPLDRLLRVVTDVRPGEAVTALLLALNIFMVLGAYYLMRPTRQALLGALGDEGTAIQAYLYGAMVLILALVVPLYGKLASTMPRRKLINIVTMFFAACLAVFYVVLPNTTGATPGIVFFVWLGIFSVMVIAQLWAFANDLYTRDEGERLFPLVAFGASSGAVFGAIMSRSVIPAFGVYLPMLLAAVLLMLTLLVTNYIDTRERRLKEADLPTVFTTGAMPAATQEIPLSDIRAALTGEMAVEDVAQTLTGEFTTKEVRAALEQRERADEGVKDARAQLEETAQDLDLSGGESPFRMVFRCRYLLMIGVLVLLLNWVNTTGEIILTGVVNTAAGEAVAAGDAAGTAGEFVGTFWASFYTVQNIIALFLQLFVVSRVIKYLGVRVGLMVLPVIALGAYALIAFYPILAYVRAAKLAENATDYSVNNTVRQVLFLPLTREQKYKAKQVIDAFFHRAGDVLFSTTYFIGTTFLAFQTKQFALFNLVLVAIWLVLAYQIGKEYGRLKSSGRPPCVGG
ncbi:MAG: hypothetical protein V3R71_06425 [Gemmatimonadales bacterium]